MSFMALDRIAATLAVRPRGLAREDGQGLIEYALIISLIAIIAVAALTLTGHSITGILNKISGDV